MESTKVTPTADPMFEPDYFPFIEEYIVSYVRDGRVQASYHQQPPYLEVRNELYASIRTYQRQLVEDLASPFPELRKCDGLRVYRIEENQQRKQKQRVVFDLEESEDLHRYMLERQDEGTVPHVYIEGTWESRFFLRHVLGAVALVGMFGALKSYCKF